MPQCIATYSYIHTYTTAIYVPATVGGIHNIMLKCIKFPIAKS